MYMESLAHYLANYIDHEKYKPVDGEVGVLQEIIEQGIKAYEKEYLSPKREGTTGRKGGSRMSTSTVCPASNNKHIKPGMLVIGGGGEGARVVLVTDDKESIKGTTFCGVVVGILGDGEQDMNGKYSRNWAMECFFPFVGEVVFKENRARCEGGR